MIEIGVKLNDGEEQLVRVWFPRKLIKLERKE